MTDGKMENESSFGLHPDDGQEDFPDVSFSDSGSSFRGGTDAPFQDSTGPLSDREAEGAGGSRSVYESGAGDTSSRMDSAHTRREENTGYPSSPAAGGDGRYYSYHRDAPSGPAGPAGYGGAEADGYSRIGGNSRRSGNGNRVLGLVLAVILVFILGAGAGAYISGRSTAAVWPGSSRNAAGGASESGEAADEEAPGDAGDGEKAEDRQEDRSGKPEEGTASRQGNTIQKVSDEDFGTSLQDTTVADVAEKVMPAIVSVYNKYTEQSQFFGRTYTQEAEATGSGIIIEESDGELLIVTNNHVVEGADSLSVQFIDEENCEAALKGTDASSDLAVISVSLDDLSADTKSKIAIAELGDSDSLRIGEHAIAIGNALGYGQSLTVGYISALNREMTSENGITGTFIQTDAAINPGNSGGALLNSKGQVIGINSNKIGGSTVEGMGFAIPISKAVPIIDSLKKQESRTKVAEEDQGVLGIYGISVTSDVASAYGLPVGAYVEELIEGGGAEKSDLQQGDIITGINGQTVTGMEDLQQQLSFYAAGTEVTLTVQHPMEGGSYEEHEIPVTLTKRAQAESSRDSQNGRRQEQQQTWPYEDEEDDSFFRFPFGF